MSWTDRSIRELLSAIAAPTPTPAGGSIAALGAASGAALLLMIAQISLARTRVDADRDELISPIQRLREMIDSLIEAIDQDAAAYDKVASVRSRVAAARKGPEVIALEDHARQDALRAATEVPLNVLRLATEAFELAQVVAPRARMPATSDLSVAVVLLGAGVRGARHTVLTNLAVIHDQGYVERMATELRELALRHDRAATVIDRLLVSAPEI